ncbi:MAG TPA: thioredoxin domain-containing protein [Phycisphaerae bacterium]
MPSNPKTDASRGKLSTPTSHEAPRAARPARFVAGSVFLVIGLAATLMLVLEHLGGLSLPGCGPGSACARAAASVWGRVPYLNWPVSFVGCAYFSAMLVAWLLHRGGVSPALRYTVRAGALVSLGYVIVIFAGRHLCPYCLVTHAANFAFWFVAERAPRSTTCTWRQASAALLMFAATTVVLAVIQARHALQAQQAAESALAESTAKIIAASKHPAGTQPATISPVPETKPSERPSGSQEAAASPVVGGAPATSPGATVNSQAAAISTQPAPRGFTSRYRLGPEAAPIRLVIFSDYQCKDCKRIEEEVHQLLTTRGDVSLSAKQFPMCVDCNRMFSKQVNPHPNACWASRAAVTAAMLRGNDGFWQMHWWLFAHEGGFTRPELEAAVKEMGYDVTEFTTIMSSEQTVKPVQEDIEEGVALGLHFTPMIFINGVELKGWNAPEAVTRAVEALAATNPPPATAENDHPASAAEKFIADWREQKVVRLPPDEHPRVRGPADAPVTVVIWGDYQDPFSAAADKIIRELVDSRSDARYEFRHFPFDKLCNPKIPEQVHPQGCLACQAAEAAGVLGGDAGFWQMHEWLMQNRKDLDEAKILGAAVQLGFDLDAFKKAMVDPQVPTAVIEDINAGYAIGLQSIPLIIINNRFVPRWQREGDNVLERIVNDASAK